MSEDRVQYKLMLPGSLKADLEAAAYANRRSLSSEIIDRLSYSLAHPPEEYAKLKSQAMRLEVDALQHEEKLNELNDRFDDLLQASKHLKVAADQGFDYQRRLMYFVLGYVDDIPEDLAIWAFDIIASIERTEMLRAGAQEPGLSTVDLRKIVKERREAYKREAMEALREHLAEIASEAASKSDE